MASSSSHSFGIVLILLLFASHGNEVVFGGQCDHMSRRAGVRGGGGDIPCTKNLGLCNGPDDNMCNYNCRHDDYPLGFCGECVRNKQTGHFDCICHLCY